MPLTKLLLLGLVVGSNNLAAALALGALGGTRVIWRIATVVGMFEFVVPLIGISLGRVAAARIEEHGQWVGVALLAGLGLWIVVMGLRRRPVHRALAERLTSWSGLVLLAAALSVDNLLIGFSLGLGGTEPLLVAGTIALFSVLFTLIGIWLGSVSRRHWERYAEVGAGLLLLALAAAKSQGWI